MTIFIIEKNNISLKGNIIGDPHLGRKFSSIPLHRRGEYQALQLSVFKKQLELDTDFCIIVGDLFDTFVVNNEILIEAYQLIVAAMMKRPNKQFYILAGNHDLSRDTTLISSFSVLKKLCERFERIILIDTITSFNIIDNINILIVPYSPYQSSVEYIDNYIKTQHSSIPFYELVAGHWDIETIGGEHNLMPYSILPHITNVVMSGHIHKPYEFFITKEGIRTTKETKCVVKGVGSMLPYAHGEDPDGTYYVTHTLEEVENNLSIDISYYHNKFLRIIKTKDSELPEEIDCLQLSFKYLDDVEEKLEVTSEEFSFKDIFLECFKNNELSDETISTWWDKYQQGVGNAN